MNSWLEALLPWGTEVIVWAQSLSTPWLDSVSLFFTWLGYEQFYLFVLPLVYWCVHKRMGIGLGFISLLSAWSNSAIKHIFQIPRPADPRLRIPLPETSPSFPSGHAQNAVAGWGYLATQLRNRLVWVVSLVAMAGIGLSRVVLGVHYPQDVLAGWFMGLILLIVYSQLAGPVGHWIGRQRMAVQNLLAIALPLLLVFLHPADMEGAYPAEGVITPTGAMLGLGVGLAMEQAWLRFRVEGTWWQRILRFPLGLGMVALLYAGPKLIIPADLSPGLDATIRFGRYALLGWVVAFLVPTLFVRLRLAEREAGERSIP